MPLSVLAALSGELTCNIHPIHPARSHRPPTRVLNSLYPR